MGYMTLEQVERQVYQLKPQEQLRLVARISERLSAIMPLSIPKIIDKSPQQEDEVERLLALCDEAAEMWEGSFDAASDIRQMRREQEEKLWLKLIRY